MYRSHDDSVSQMKLPHLLSLSLLVCSSSSIRTSIVGGDVVPGDNDDFRFIVSLQQVVLPLKKGKKVFKHICGGSLINDYWVLTAAHCLRQWPDRLRVGSYKLDRGGKIRRVSRIVVHPDNVGGTLHDIALVKMNRSVKKFTKIKLNDTFDVDGTTLTSIGWGYMEESSGKLTTKLMSVSLQVYPFEKCIKKLNVDEFSMLCTLGALDDNTGVRKDACFGDSGGPNFIFSPISGESTIVGVTSWGKGCGRVDSPGVTARVSSYTSWIESVVN